MRSLGVGGVDSVPRESRSELEAELGWEPKCLIATLHNVLAKPGKQRPHSISIGQMEKGKSSYSYVNMTLYI